MKTRDERQKGMMVTFAVIASTIAFSAALRFFDGAIGYPNCLSNLPSLTASVRRGICCTMAGMDKPVLFSLFATTCRGNIAIWPICSLASSPRGIAASISFGAHRCTLYHTAVSPFLSALRSSLGPLLMLRQKFP